jgi:hypothetical protein
LRFKYFLKQKSPPKPKVCITEYRAQHREQAIRPHCNIFGLTSATERCIGNKHFSYSRPTVTPALIAHSVSVPTGKIELIRMFFAPSSFDKETVMAPNAALPAEYNEAAGSGILLAPELILIILPPYCQTVSKMPEW